MGLRETLEAADAGPWWFDGRDIFHKRPGTNLDQIIIPIPSADETFHGLQAVLPDTARLAALAPELAALCLHQQDTLNYLRRVYGHLMSETELLTLGALSDRLDRLGKEQT